MANHDTQRIAHSAVAAVDSCACGTVHLHIGSITIHLTPNALRSLAHTLQAATLRLEDGGDEVNAWPVRSAVRGTA